MEELQILWGHKSTDTTQARRYLGFVTCQTARRKPGSHVHRRMDSLRCESLDLTLHLASSDAGVYCSAKRQPQHLLGAEFSTFAALRTLPRAVWSPPRVPPNFRGRRCCSVVWTTFGKTSELSGVLATNWHCTDREHCSNYLEISTLTNGVQPARFDRTDAREVMKRLLVLGVLVFGITALGPAQSGNGNGNCDGNGNGNGGGNGCPVQMPEGPAFELPLFLLGAASWGVCRHYSKTRKGMDSPSPSGAQAGNADLGDYAALVPFRQQCYPGGSPGALSME
jgi:hypothetical protein